MLSTYNHTELNWVKDIGTKKERTITVRSFRYLVDLGYIFSVEETEKGMVRMVLPLGLTVMMPS